MTPHGPPRLETRGRAHHLTPRSLPLQPQCSRRPRRAARPGTPVRLRGRGTPADRLVCGPAVKRRGAPGRTRGCGRRRVPVPAGAGSGARGEAPRQAPMAGRSLGQAVATVSLSVALASLAVRSSGCRGIPAPRYPVCRAGCGSQTSAGPAVPTFLSRRFCRGLSPRTGMGRRRAGAPLDPCRLSLPS